MAYFFYSKNQKDEEISNEIAKHISLIKISNEISSYAKRSEGHMLLYLTIGDSSDRDKVPKRTAKLKDYIERLQPLLSDNDSLEIFRILRTKHQKFNQLSEIIFHEYDKTGFDYVRTESGKQYIDNLHSISSGIRKLGVKLVDISTKALDSKKHEIEVNNDAKYKAMAIFTSIAFLFLIIITYQSGKLVVSARLTESLEKLSLNDALTGIGNRRFFDEQFDKEWQRCIRSSSSFALLLIDVDHFKSFNDTYGHVKGDDCLIRVAQSLKNCLKRPTDVIARYGGEEFVVILPETTNPMQIAETCKKKIEELKIPNKGSKVSPYVTVSIGLGIKSPANGDSSSTFINAVDSALYKAKENGRNQVHEIV